MWRNGCLGIGLVSVKGDLENLVLGFMEEMVWWLGFDQAGGMEWVDSCREEFGIRDLGLMVSVGSIRC